MYRAPISVVLCMIYMAATLKQLDELGLEKYLPGKNYTSATS